MWFSLTFPVCSKFPDFSLTGKCLAIFPGFPVRVGTLLVDTHTSHSNWDNILHLTMEAPLITNSSPMYIDTKMVGKFVFIVQKCSIVWHDFLYRWTMYQGGGVRVLILANLCSMQFTHGYHLEFCNLRFNHWIHDHTDSHKLWNKLTQTNQRLRDYKILDAP